jgi:hypothetical protein
MRCYSKEIYTDALGQGNKLNQKIVYISGSLDPEKKNRTGSSAEGLALTGTSVGRVPCSTAE